MKIKRILSVLLAVVMVFGCAFTLGLTASADTGTAVKDYGLGATKNDGLILQAWNWSYEEIEKNLETIAECGYTTIQISPPNEIKAPTLGETVLRADNANGWWMMYQPAAYELNQSEDNALGTKDQMIRMIEKAHSMGMFVIADAVINHLGNNESADYTIDKNKIPKNANAVDYLCSRAWEFESSKAIINANAFHYPYANCAYNDTGAFDCTQNAVSLLPDLDTSNAVVQETILSFWQECIDAGIDGFRIDAAKHIETKYDGEYASDFWDNLMYDGVNGKQGIVPYAADKYGKDLYFYGEILNTVSTERSYSWYLEYMNITNSTAFYSICDAVNNGKAENAVPKTFNNGMTNSTAVLWDESHDTYMDGCKTKSIPSQKLILKRWACMASRADVVSMYLARPTNTPADVYDLTLGTAYDTDWNNTETAVVNKFHNHFQGTPETVSSSGNIAVIERADSGVVLVNCRNNASELAVNVTMQSLADGTYVDQMTGNTFTCKDGKLTGNIGTTGVAVIYNPEDAVIAASKESCNFTTDTIDVDIVANGKEATYSVNGGTPVAYTGKTTLTLGADLSSSGSAVIGILGDANSDGNVNVKDATAIQKHIAGLITLTSDQILLANVLEDLDNDGNPNLNIKDATAIQKSVAGISVPAEVGKEIGTDGGAGAVTLTLACDNITKEYTYNKVSEDDIMWVRFDNSETKFTHVYCYAFIDGKGENNMWPGVLMTEKENDIWYYEIPEELKGATIIFSDNIQGTGTQTGDLPTADPDTGAEYSRHFTYKDGKWFAVLDDGSMLELEETHSGNYIVFTDIYNWGGSKKKINYYAWEGGPAMSWPGKQMDYIGPNENGEDQYAVYIDRGYTKVIFNNGSKQTSDLSVKGSCGYYPLSNGTKPQCGTFDVTA